MSSKVRKSSYIFENRVTFLGASKVGKTAIIDQITKQSFNDRYEPTVQNHLNHVIDNGKEIFICLIVDTCGEDDFPVMRQLAISKGNAFVIVYSITSRKTFERAKQQIAEIKSLKGSGKDQIKIVLVGNKKDLEKDRAVSSEEGEKCARNLNAENVEAFFLEASAKDHASVEKILFMLTSHGAATQLGSPSCRKDQNERSGSTSKLPVRRKTSKALIMKKQMSSVSESREACSSDSESGSALSLSTQTASPALSPVLHEKLRFFRRSNSVSSSSLNFSGGGSLKRGERRASTRLPWLRGRSKSLSHIEISKPSLLSTSARHRFESSQAYPVEQLRSQVRRSSVSSRHSTDDDDHDSGLSDGVPSPLPSPELRHLRSKFRRQGSLLDNVSEACKEKLQNVGWLFRRDGSHKQRHTSC